MKIIEQAYQRMPKLTQGWGSNPSFYKKFGWAGHAGYDFALGLGTKIYSPFNGSIKVLTSDGWGNYVRIIVNKEGYDEEWTIAHFSEIKIKSGAVKEGDLIGLEGSTGISTGSHSHWGVRILKNGKIQDTNNGYNGYIEPKQLFSLHNNHNMKQEEFDKMLLNSLKNPLMQGAIAEALIPENIEKIWVGEKKDEFYNLFSYKGNILTDKIKKIISLGVSRTMKIINKKNNS
jgi:murein DD-endopeptidase MepM/ murein hydrolase activator NlpD